MASKFWGSSPCIIIMVFFLAIPSITRTCREALELFPHSLCQPRNTTQKNLRYVDKSDSRFSTTWVQILERTSKKIFLLCTRRLLHGVGQVEDIQEDVRPGDTRQTAEEEAASEGCPALSGLRAKAAQRETKIPRHNCMLQTNFQMLTWSLSASFTRPVKVRAGAVEGAPSLKEAMP